jgi:transcriptional regulator with XRE-family HTH domain
VKFPQSQRELLLTVRGNRSQADFAALIGVARSSLSRYENEQLGLPTKALNACLRELTKMQHEQSGKHGILIPDLLDKAVAVADGLKRLA